MADVVTIRRIRHNGQPGRLDAVTPEHAKELFDRGLAQPYGEPDREGAERATAEPGGEQRSVTTADVEGSPAEGDESPAVAPEGDAGDESAGEGSEGPQEGTEDDE